jgi:hypothetical protein
MVSVTDPYGRILEFLDRIECVAFIITESVLVSLSSDSNLTSHNCGTPREGESVSA